MTVYRLAAVLSVALGFVPPALALSGREVVDTAQQRNGFSTWKDRSAGATMQTYDKGSLARTREIDITEQTNPRGEHRTFMEFTGPADVTGTLFLHLSPRNATDQQWLWTPATRRARRLLLVWAISPAIASAKSIRSTSRPAASGTSRRTRSRATRSPSSSPSPPSA